MAHEANKIYAAVTTFKYKRQILKKKQLKKKKRKEFLCIVFDVIYSDFLTSVISSMPCSSLNNLPWVSPEILEKPIQNN